VAVGLLDRPAVAQDRLGLGHRPGGEEAARGLDQVARPDQVVAAEILVALVEAQGIDRLAITAPGNSNRLVAGQDGGAGAVGAGRGSRRCRSSGSSPACQRRQPAT